MKSWQRAPFATKCGSCGTVIREGDPLLVIAIANLQRRLRRCQGCAGEPVNWDEIAAAPAREPAEPPSFRPVGELAKTFDPRMAAAGKDPE